MNQPSPRSGFALVAPCPCRLASQERKPKVFALCCERFLSDFEGSPAPDAESLMRSRYTAFVLADRDYLLATWHPTRRPPGLAFDVGTRWLGLEVRSRKATDESHAEVEFVARCRDRGGKAVRLHERSRFVRENGRWFYLDGDML